MTALSPPDTAQTQRPGETQTETSTTSTPKATVLDSGVPDGCFVAATKEVHGRLTDLCVAKDTTGVAQLISSQLVVIVPNGTRVLVIDRAFAVREVRILDGAHAGQSGWVNYEYVVER